MLISALVAMCSWKFPPYKMDWSTIDVQDEYREDWDTFNFWDLKSKLMSQQFALIQWRIIQKRRAF